MAEGEFQDMPASERRRRDTFAAFAPHVATFYGSKFYIATSDRDARIAFGAMQPEPRPEGGKPELVPVYRAAVYMPFETLYELRNVLVELCAELGMDLPARETPPAEAEPEDAADAG